MSTRSRHCLTAFIPFATAMLAASPSFAGSWSALNKDYGGNLQMILYTPTTPAPSPAILVALHYCGGNSSNAKGWFDSAADKNGFYIIAPDAGGGANICFDASLGRSGERADIVKMVQWVIDTKKADKSRVFAAGYSSGGCMTNTLLAVYPDVFAGGSAMPGVAAGGWYPSKAQDAKHCECASGGWSSQTNPTDGKYWGDKVRAVFDYNGTRPCVQEWVGGQDQYGFAAWMPTVAAQFQNLGNLGAGTAGTGAPNGWNRTVYKDSSGNVRLETNVNPGTMHDLTSSGLSGAVVSFLGLDKSTGACGITTAGNGGAGNTGGASGGGAANGGGGGTSAQGGASVTTGGTPSNSGGKTGAGGTTSSSGGSAGGGVINNGGAVSLAGGSTNMGNGGSPGSGGSSNGSGGSSNTTFGGNATTGGASSASGASNASGASSAGSSGSGGGSNDSGCSCTVVGSPSGSSLGALAGLTAALGALVRRRRRSVG